MGSRNRSPENQIPSERGGEYSQEGFRYQASFTAKLCLELLDENTKIDEIFCEHFEDIITKNIDGTFTAIQVKHNKPDGARFTTTSERIRNSFKRFVDIENEFPSLFSRYVIVSNSFAWSTQYNYKNVNVFLKSVQDYSNLAENTKKLIDKEIESICKECDINNDELILTLIKTYCQSAYDYVDYEKSLVIDIGKLILDKTTNVVKHILIKNELISKIYSCSAINCDHPKKEYFNVIGLPSEEQIIYDVNKKRIKKEDVTKVINNYIDPKFVLKTLTDDSISKIPPGYELMEKKMIIGGIHGKSINNMKNHKVSAEEYFIEYYYRDQKEASDLYSSLRSSMLTECDECYNKTKKEDELFGQTMFDMFSDRTQIVYDDLTKYNYLGLNRYYLLGLGGILTEECVVWWSKEYELGENN